MRSHLDTEYPLLLLSLVVCRLDIAYITFKPYLMNCMDGKLPLDSLMGSHWGYFACGFIAVLYSVALYPWRADRWENAFSPFPRSDSV